MPTASTTFTRSFAREVTTAATAFAMFCVASGPARAGLYPPAAPPGSAFIRLFNGTTQRGLDAQVGDKSIHDVAPYQASAYVFLPPGSYSAKIGGISKSLKLDGSRCYTAALYKGAVKLFDQPCFDSQIKALVALYNLESGSTLSLRTANGKTKVISGVGPNQVGHREVNAISARFAVFSSGKKLAEAQPKTLERGKAFSLFVTGSAAQPNLVWIVN